jgi:hypothetical protein
MKAKILLALLASVVATQSSAAGPARVFVSSKISQTNGCNSKVDGITEAFINSLAREALIKKGYVIANTKQEATDGLRVQFDLKLCGLSFGANVTYTSSMGMYAISAGSSVASPDSKELPFTYSNAFAFAAGDSTSNQASRLAEYIKPQIREHINSTF